MPGAQLANLVGEFINGELHIKDSSNVDVLVIGATTGLRSTPVGTVTTATANLSLLTSHCGKVVLCATDAVVFTLPSTCVGLRYTIINMAAPGAAGIIVTTAATTDTFVGCGWASTDLPYRITNTKATANPGDSVVVASGISTGIVWQVLGLVGTWTSVT